MGHLSGVPVTGHRVLARLPVCRVSPGVAEMPDGHGLRSARGDPGVGEAPTAGAHPRISAVPDGTGRRPAPRSMASQPPSTKSAHTPRPHSAPPSLHVKHTPTPHRAL